MSTGSAPAAITAGPDGNLWYADESDHIGRVTTAGVITEFSAGITAGAVPAAITAGPDGNLWFTESGRDGIGRITPTGVITEFTAGISPGSVPSGITAGPDGNLWFTEFQGNRVARITPSGVVTEYSAGLSPGSGPGGIVAGPDGKLWFAQPGNDSIGRLQLDPLAPADSDGDGLADGTDACPAIAAPTPSGCPNTSTPPPTLSTITSLSQTRADAKGIVTLGAVTCQAPGTCTVKIVGKAKLTKKGKAKNVGSGSRAIGAGKSGKPMLKLSSAAKKALKKAKKLKLTVTVTVASPGNPSMTKTYTLTVKASKVQK